VAKGGRPRVVDFSIHFSGPIASRQLAQLGADVIKFEHPAFGDHNRQAPPVEDGISPLHYYINAGARSLAISSRSPAWLPAVEAAAKWADVVIVGNRPESARRMGIDLASLLGHNPDLVYCLITGYGMEGEWADYAAHGLNLDALAGVVAIESRDGYPIAPTAYRSYGTTLAGLQAAIGILDALYRRSLGQGAQFVHTSCWEAALGWMWRDVTTYANLGRPWDEYMDLGSRYSMYWTSDRRALLVCPIEKHFWERFCDAVGLGPKERATGQWLDGVDFGRGYEDEKAAIAERVATRTLDEWQTILAKADVPFAPILTWIEAMESDHATANGVTANLTYGGKTVRTATTPVSVTPVTANTPLENIAKQHRDKGADLQPPPRLGEQSLEILEELGVGHLANELGAAKL
jgi:crotonobetainyl-CoA:carnitine CoA-transferase CaiB-like acyl-CoA transferase